MTTPLEKWKMTQAGIQKATNTTNQKHPKWSDQAYSFLLQYARNSPVPFCADQLGTAAEKMGLPEPVNRWAWGGVMARAARNGYIQKAYMANYHYPDSDKAHTKQTTFWEITN